MNVGGSCDFDSHNSLKLNFTNILGLCSIFVDCESFLESNSPDILTLCETNLDGSINSGNFFVFFVLSKRILVLIYMVSQFM